MIWFIELIVLLVAVVLFLNGWILPFIGMGFLLLCLAGDVHAAMKKVKEKSETNKKDLV
ncbi:hypothetical protein ERHA55_29510 [Erwinia rhapontici]|uniref:Uncharacterized protein n=1 Tax=Erwinia rhapontici TaxID=55212 RepID=A0ABN6DPS5_ERWRD|nr:hypothetical protein [Erwinia rhapontici]BCQ35280.1 hypothetical protein ERHA53_26230 [Erwinia rhapontici]BCQ45424.1 hypothetical protein ERHA55_29510 [Erwinia rhapontici]